MLYHVVQFCRASGWLVLYVPTRESSDSLDCLCLRSANMRLLTFSNTLHSVGSLKDYDNERAAGTILARFLKAEAAKLKDIEFKKNGPSLYDFISDGLDNQKYFETWEELFSLIRAEELKYVFHPIFFLSNTQN